MIDKDDLIDALALKPFGQKGWIRNREACPYCGKPDKWGILIEGNSKIFHCFRCGEKTSLFNYLKKIGRADLCESDYKVSKNNFLKSIENEELIVNENEVIELPFGLKPLTNDSYLNSRGFTREHYAEFEPSYTDSPLEENLNNYIVFKLKQGESIVGWLARSRYTKEWHKQNLHESKKKGIPPMLRYRNSENGFVKIVGGVNFIGNETKIVIVVEGLFDKINVDKLLDLRKGDVVACVFTFGKKISGDQANILLSLEIETLILLYDGDAMEQSKEASITLGKKFKVLVAKIEDKTLDPGDMDITQLSKALGGATDPMNFYLNNIEGIS